MCGRSVTYAKVALAAVFNIQNTGTILWCHDLTSLSSPLGRGLEGGYGLEILSELTTK